MPYNGRPRIAEHYALNTMLSPLFHLSARPRHKQVLSDTLPYRELKTQWRDVWPAGQSRQEGTPFMSDTTCQVQ